MNNIICSGYLRALAQEAEDIRFRNCYAPYLKPILAAANNGYYNCEIWCSNYEFLKEMQLRGFNIEVKDFISDEFRPFRDFEEKDFITAMEVRIDWYNAGSF